MEKWTMYWAAGIVVLGIIILGLLVLEDNYRTDLKEEFNYDESKGEELIQCPDESIEVYRPQEPFPKKICGEMIYEQI